MCQYGICLSLSNRFLYGLACGNAAEFVRNQQGGSFGHWYRSPNKQNRAFGDIKLYKKEPQGRILPIMQAFTSTWDPRVLRVQLFILNVLHAAGPA